MQTTNICKIEPNETKAWLMSPVTPSDQEMDQVYSTATAALKGPQRRIKKLRCEICCQAFKSCTDKAVPPENSYQHESVTRSDKQCQLSPVSRVSSELY